MVNSKNNSARNYSKNFAKPSQKNFRSSSSNSDGERGSFRSNSSRFEGERRPFGSNSGNSDGERGSFRSNSRSSAPKRRPSWELPQFEGQKKFFKKPWGSSKPFTKNRRDSDENFTEDFRESRSFSKRPRQNDENFNQDSRSQERGFGNNQRSNDENFSRNSRRDDRSNSGNSYSQPDSRSSRNSSSGFRSKEGYREKFSKEKPSNFANKDSSNRQAKHDSKQDRKPNRPFISPFHLAIPVNDLQETRKFYGEMLGLTEGRSHDNWIDWNLFGHQLVTHLRPTEIDSRTQQIVNQVDDHGVPVPHFGVVLGWKHFHNFAQKLKDAQMQFVIEPYIRFQGQVGEQATMFFYDPSGNALEFKSFQDIDQLFKKFESKKSEELELKSDESQALESHEHELDSNDQE